MTRPAFRLPIALLLALAAVRPAGAESPAKTPTASRELPPIFDREALGERQLDWFTRVCYQSNRRMLVFFGTNDCVPCRTANRAVHADKFYEAMIRQFVPVFIDVTPGGPNVDLLTRFGIDPKKGMPGVVVFDNEHRLLEVLKNGEMAEVAKKGDEAVQAWILARFIKTET
jgi:thiol:disulfide interchange protein